MTSQSKSTYVWVRRCQISGKVARIPETSVPPHDDSVTTIDTAFHQYERVARDGYYWGRSVNSIPEGV